MRPKREPTVRNAENPALRTPEWPQNRTITIVAAYDFKTKPKRTGFVKPPHLRESRPL